MQTYNLSRQPPKNKNPEDIFLSSGRNTLISRYHPILSENRTLSKPLTQETCHSTQLASINAPLFFGRAAKIAQGEFSSAFCGASQQNGSSLWHFGRLLILASPKNILWYYTTLPRLCQQFSKIILAVLPNALSVPCSITRFL